MPPALRNFAPEHYINRELSLMAFNRRVLAQAADERVPLLDRLRFLCIVSANIDEFFEIRVAGLKEQMKLGGATRCSADGLAVEEVYRQVSLEAHALIAEQYALLNTVILPRMRDKGIFILRRSEWHDAQKQWIGDYFNAQVMPILTPIGLDPAHPFPRVLNKSLNFAIALSGHDDFGRTGGAAIVQAPRALPRVIRLPQALCPAGADYAFIFLSSVIHEYVHDIFPGMDISGCYQFRLTRNSDLWVDDEEVKNLRITLQGELPQRHFGDAVRLEIPDNCSDVMANFLRQQFGLGADDVYQVPGIVNLVRLMSLPDQVNCPDLLYRPFHPATPKALAKRADIFSVLRKGDVLLHHPYQSFLPVVNLLENAADDPQVVAIKMTVYRTGTDSVLLEHLVRAAQKGKEVTVVIELMARFDEEANLSIAGRLEEVGAHVVYGVFGYKTHAKLLMVLRREGEGFRRYVHLGTGNYHPRTTRFYTDFGLLTCHPEITSDVAEMFKQMTGMGKARDLLHLWRAPFTLHANLMASIRAETAQARAGQPARIIAKMNSLLEPEMIEVLYEASQAGVDIDLIVRGVCALRPQQKNLSERIRVRSVIGRFLEHHRIFYFWAQGQEQLYLSSADWMERNFFRRIETAFPVLDKKLKQRVLKEGLLAYLKDNSQSWIMDANGRYALPKPKRGTTRFCVQESLIQTLSCG
jgi:polyphosphate kinase